MNLILKMYHHDYETGWLRCRVLSFLYTAYHDDVLQKKTDYQYASTELIVCDEDEVVGLFDMEFEDMPGDVCSKRPGKGAMIWNLAVLPEYQNKGVATSMLEHAVKLAKMKRYDRIEAWTRDDKKVIEWYEKRGFKLIDKYLHVYIDDEENRTVLKSQIEGLQPINTFAHYTGKDEELIKKKFKRVHECRLYELLL